MCKNSPLADAENGELIAKTEDKSELKEDPSKATSKPSLMKIFMMAAPETLMMFVTLLFIVAGEYATLIVPLIIADGYDTLIVNINGDEDTTMAAINSIMAKAMILYFTGAFVTFLRTAIQGMIGERLVARLRCKLYRAILKQEIAFFDEHKTGELVSRLGSDTTLLQSVVSLSMPEVITGVAKTIAAVVLMFLLSPKLAGASLGGVVVLFLFSVPLGKSLGNLSKEYQDVLGEAQTYSTEAFGSMRTVQAFAAEEKEINRFEGHIGNPDLFPRWWPTMKEGDAKSTYRVGFFKSLVNAGFFSWIFGAGFGFLYVSLWYGFYLVNQGELSIGQLTAFQSYVFNIGFGLGQIGANAAKLLEGLGASGRIFYLLDRIPQIPKPASSDNKQSAEKSLKPTSMEGNIEFTNVKFCYPSRPGMTVLDDFSLKIPSRTTTALVGSSGTGKSTAVALLQRFYDIDSGSITIDNNNLNDLDLHWLRSHLGYVQQEPQLFGLSVRDNLLYGVERKVSQAEIETACRNANAHEFISSWTEGYDTMVGERGVKLSGGQKQRVAIARALLTNCSILLLDEATSALDAESEHLVQQAIDKAVVGRTVIVIAHRLSTIRAADQIVVMDNHKIVDVGTHEKLLESCVKYQDLIKRQNMK